MHVFCDFDGTIARCDVTDLVLQEFAAPAWRDIERDWIEGAIDAAACMRRQIALIDATFPQLDALLETVEIDPGFASFATWCAGRGMPLTVVSDGVDYFIRQVLARHDLAHLPVFANQLERRPGGGFDLQQPWRADSCAAGSGVCKCAVTARAHALVIYVGDGRSDYCPARRANVLFAKDSLAVFCAQNRLSHRTYAGFDDVRDALAGVVFDAETRLAPEALRWAQS